MSEPEHDDRKKAGMQWILALAFGAFCTGYMKRHRFAPLKSRKITCVLRVPVCRRAVAGGGRSHVPRPLCRYLGN